MSCEHSFAALIILRRISEWLNSDRFQAMHHLLSSHLRKREKKEDGDNKEKCAIPSGPKHAVARTANKSVQQRACASAPRVKFERHRTCSISEIVNFMLSGWE